MIDYIDAHKGGCCVIVAVRPSAEREAPKRPQSNE
jgi:hypothetical protein